MWVFGIELKSLRNLKALEHCCGYSMLIYIYIYIYIYIDIYIDIDIDIDIYI